MNKAYVTRDDLYPEHQDKPIHKIDFFMLDFRVHELCISSIEVIFVDEGGATKCLNDQRAFGHLSFDRYVSAMSSTVVVNDSKEIIDRIESKLKQKKKNPLWSDVSSITMEGDSLKVVFETSRSAVIFAFHLVRRGIAIELFGNVS